MKTGVNAIVAQIKREQSVHPCKPKGCNGWWSATDRALLHGAATCPIHHAEVLS